jgi:transposase
MQNTIPIPAEILGISNIIIENAKIDNNGDFIISVRNKDSEIRCSKCEGPTFRHGHGRSVSLRHLPVFGHKTYIEIAPARGICKKCDDHPTTTESHEWYTKGTGYTKAYEQQILLQLINSTVMDVSTKEDIGYKSIEAVVDRYIDTKVNWNVITQIGLLGIDEISLKKGYRDYVTIITSNTSNGVKTLSIIKGREKLSVKSFLFSIPRSLKQTIIAVCTDMYDGYINAAKKEALGQDVPVVADRYHVSKLYRKSLVTLRKRELKKLKKSLAKEEYQDLKPPISLLCRRKEYPLTQNEEKK